jgi:hypothetical protein
MLATAGCSEYKEYDSDTCSLINTIFGIDLFYFFEPIAVLSILFFLPLYGLVYIIYFILWLWKRYPSA